MTGIVKISKPLSDSVLQGKLIADMDATGIAMLGRMFATGAYYICLQCASEVFPTVIRGKGVATCEIMGGIGLFVCPMIVYLVMQWGC